MTMTTIRPGLLVALKTSVEGGVVYERRDLERGEGFSRWETVRTVADPDEHKRATEARTKAAGAIRSACITTSFGLLCPTTNEEDLDIAVEKAQDIVALHNANARHTKVRLFVLKGRVSENDTEAARAINQEIGELMAEMSAALDKADPKAIRDAASRARALSGMLAESEQKKATAAIEAARVAARAIVKRVEKAGEDAATVLAELDRSAIETARIAFLDLGDAAMVEALPSVNLQRFADLGEEAEPEPGPDENARQAFASYTFILENEEVG